MTSFQIYIFPQSKRPSTEKKNTYSKVQLIWCTRLEKPRKRQK